MFSEFTQIKNDIVSSIERNGSIVGSRSPMIGKSNEVHQWQYPQDYFWTDSFWTGELWLAYMLTGEEKYKNMARMRYSDLKEFLEQPIKMNHDLGFVFTLSAVADYKLTGNLEARALALRAAEALRGRFNWNGNYLVAWTAGSEGPEHAKLIQGKIIIDCMQNLSLLLWAYKETGNETYRTVAIAQAETSLKYLVRKDFSTYHTYDFDTTTNEPIAGRTYQGYADESCWSRGQAWAIHGFAQLAHITGDAKYADISHKLAEYMYDVITPDLIPVWDYRLPDSEIQYKDSSAGSISASGLLLLAEFYTKQGDDERAKRHHNFGVEMLLALREKHDLTQQPGSQGLLSEAASHVHLAHSSGEMNLANAMLPYGDYYYFEGVLRALGFGHARFFW